MTSGEIALTTPDSDQNVTKISPLGEVQIFEGWMPSR
jgi:hypothetical protein